MKRKQAKAPNFLILLIVFFSMSPFFLPIPGLGSDLQPYALLLGFCILPRYSQDIGIAFNKNRSFLMLLFPLALAVIFTVADGFSFVALRAAYNHFSIFFVFLILYILVSQFGFPEDKIKLVLWFWVIVASVQFFVDKGFLADLISGERERAFSRGVVGLCSEASFFGISCFYFLHLANRFKQKRVFYLLLITAMAIFYAQSMQGLLFVCVFYIGLMIETINSRKGIVLAISIALGCVIGYYLLQQIAPDSRLVELINEFLNDGIMKTINGDVSATNRLNSITGALEKAFDNWLIPQGFSVRFGSGFGGLLVELGFLGLFETFVIAYGFCIHFNKVYTRIIYFLLVYFILFSNTHMGNPQLLFVLAINHFFNQQEKPSNESQTTAPKKRYYRY